MVGTPLRPLGQGRPLPENPPPRKIALLGGPRTPASEKELYAQLEAVREAARQAHLKELERVSRKRVAAAKKPHAAQVRRQKEFLRSIGVLDLTPQEASERASDGRNLHARSNVSRRKRLRKGVSLDITRLRFYSCVDTIFE